VSQSFGCIPKSGIAGSYGRSMFRFLRSLQIFFQSGCTSLHSHQQRKGVPFSPHPHQNLLLVVLLMMAVLTGVRWNLSLNFSCFKTFRIKTWVKIIWIDYDNQDFLNAHYLSELIREFFNINSFNTYNHFTWSILIITLFYRWGKKPMELK
jgi:hypothetical protein